MQTNLWLLSVNIPLFPSSVTIFESHYVLCQCSVSPAPNLPKLSLASCICEAWHSLRSLPFLVSFDDAKVESSRKLLMYHLFSMSAEKFEYELSYSSEADPSVIGTRQIVPTLFFFFWLFFSYQIHLISSCFFLKITLSCPIIDSLLPPPKYYVMTPNCSCRSPTTLLSILL